ncbi:acetyl-CoA carboxylase, carboxyltransferase subunit beta [Hugenholtzia roseola]|uniref:acetyl-CoA carboxylase, carboxyltransferase subunit beta n=1 Tax=Hugenholtzia roseola TaxID=1002 RepID=UPI00041E03BB|nr:acetyl-CoA carboxylase, carboxyltransferase subunit beta [Hugenholtzia roseola]
MAWFQRKDKNITTPTTEKRDSPDMWFKTPSGKIILKKELAQNAWVCPDDGYHVAIGSKEYFSILFDDNTYTELNADLCALDPLQFYDTKPYTARLQSAKKSTGFNDALSSAYGKIEGQDLVVCCMNFKFIGGSMGSVVGEKISLAIDFCLENKMPLLIISQSGGARMMEAGYSLMQMAKTSAKLALLSDAKLPYISLLTNPTTGGVTASYAMLGDFNIAEPEALIGFAGPRVIRETIGKDLPKGFQTAEFVLEHGFLDFIVDRRELKQKLALLLKTIRP